jgi:hypothetical protein
MLADLFVIQMGLKKRRAGPCAFCFTAFWPVRARRSGLGAIAIGRSLAPVHFVTDPFPGHFPF